MNNNEDIPVYTSRELPRFFQFDFEIQGGAVRLYAGWFWVIAATLGAIGVHGGCG